MKDRAIFPCRRFLATVGILLLSFYSPGLAAVVTKLTVVEHEGRAELWVDSDKPLKCSQLYLSTNPRLVLDIDNTSLQKKSVLTLSENSAIKTVRYSTNKDHRLRLVFDLKAQFNVTRASDELSGHRLKFILKNKKTESKATPARDIVIVIDPGHGGKDPGACGRRGSCEKTVVLEIAKALQRQINQQQGFTAVLTRHGDYYLTLRGRLEQARKYHADMFVAIHADAYMNNDAEGASVYALSLRGASSEAARWLASRENESELMGGVDLTDKSALLKSVLLDLSQAATLRASLQVGATIINALSSVTTLHQSRVEQAAFVVLKSPDIPSLLVETGFISNPVEERKLKSKAYQWKIARAVTQGIKTYFENWPPRGTTVAVLKSNSNH